MTGAFLTFLGGIGLFLFGMQTMTAALRELGGSRLREMLARFTTSPATGALIGALGTAAVQSSSAMIVTVIGFVGAGLMTFPQAVGVILGANVGTTVTGWMVMLIGFKLKLGAAALPLLFIAALLRLFGHGRWQRAGALLGGFALIFIGIETMQVAMTGLEGWLTPGILPPDTWAGRVQLVGLGVLVTLLTQSSSAGVATALVLLGAGAIGFTQAAALVIGMYIGTTFTAVLASLGGSRAMRRTAVAHVCFNLFNGALAFASLGIMAPLVLVHVAGGEVQLGLVAFHTTFNLIGVLLFLPFTRPFARLVERMVPATGEPLDDLPDRSLLADAGAALDAAQGALGRVTAFLFLSLSAALAPGRAPLRRQAQTAARRAAPMLEALEDFLARIVLPSDQPDPLARYVAALHQADHLRRLAHRMTQAERMQRALEEPALRRPARLLAILLALAAEGREESSARLERLYSLLERRTARLRRESLAAGTASTRGDPFERTDALRWLSRAAAHAVRIQHYRAIAASERPAPGSTPPRVPD